MLKPSRILRSSAFIGTTVLLAIVFGGCLKFGIGDAEKAKVDPTLAAAWFKRDDDGAVTIWNAQAYDSRTYLVTQYRAKPDGNGGWERDNISICKAWLHNVGDAQFVTMKVLWNDGEDVFVVARIDVAGETLTVRGIDPKFVADNKVDSSAALETLIKANLDKNELYLTAEKYERASDADRETVKAIMQAFH